MTGIRHLLAASALFATTAVHAAPVASNPVYDSALGGAAMLALTDPTRAPDPDSCLLLAAGFGLLGALMNTSSPRRRGPH